MERPCICRTTPVNDDVLRCVFEFSFGHQNVTPTNILLVNKLFHTLATPIFLRTVVVRSDLKLRKILCPDSIPLSTSHAHYVKCFEICFRPTTHLSCDLWTSGTPKPFPNLEVVRFRFPFGVSIPPDIRPSTHDELVNRLLINTLSARGGSMCVAFMRRLDPVHFEWTTGASPYSYIVGVNPDLWALFAAWKQLRTVSLQGLCLADVQSLDSYRVSLPTPHVNIQTTPSSPLWHLLSIPNVIRGDTRHQVLTIEICSLSSNIWPPPFRQGAFHVASAGLTKIYLKRCTFSEMVNFQKRVVGGSLELAKGASRRRRPNIFLAKNLRVTDCLLGLLVAVAGLLCLAITLERNYRHEIQTMGKRDPDPEPATYLTYYHTMSSGQWVITSSATTYDTTPTPAPTAIATHNNPHAPKKNYY